MKSVYPGTVRKSMIAQCANQQRKTNDNDRVEKTRPNTSYKKSTAYQRLVLFFVHQLAIKLQKWNDFMVVKIKQNLKLSYNNLLIP